MNRYIYGFGISILFIYACNSSVKPDKTVRTFNNKILDLVLSEEKKEQEYVFKIMQTKGILEYSVIYLGTLSVKQQTKMVLYQSILSGESSPQANSYLIIFDSLRNTIGNYYIGSLDAPKIKDDSLVFTPIDGECNLGTAISFRDSIPKQIFIRCIGDRGDLYSFSENKK